MVVLTCRPLRRKRVRVAIEVVWVVITVWTISGRIRTKRAPLSMRARTVIRALSVGFVNEQSQVRCFPFKDGITLTGDGLVSGVSEALRSSVRFVDDGDSAAMRSGAAGVSDGSSVIDARGGARVAPLVVLARSASCRVRSL